MARYQFTALVAAFSLACVARAADVSGKWLAEFESPIGHLKYTFDLKADGGKLTGKAIREQDGQKSETEIKEGKIAGDDVSFVEVLNFDQEIRIEYTGKLAGDQIKFTRKVGDFATMEVVAKREGAAASPAQPAARKFTLKVVKVDSEETNGEDGKGANAVDGKTDTFWHTQWDGDNPPAPHEIIIELSAPARIKGFTYLPRQDDEVNGTIKQYEFYVSDDGKNFGQPVTRGSFGTNDSIQKRSVMFDVKPARFVKLRALSEINDQPWTSAAEIDVIAE
jgi:F5/8 type C domain